MGCYGLGVSRILGGLTEVHSDQFGLSLPQSVAPLTCVIITKAEDSICYEAACCLYDSIVRNSFFHEDVYIDDRREMTVGKKLIDAHILGVPWIIVFGSAWKRSSQVEIYKRSRPHEPLTIATNVNHPNWCEEIKSILNSI